MSSSTNGLAHSRREIITIKEARKLLGQEAKDLNDTQVKEIIDSLQSIAKKYLSTSSSKNSFGI
ncbi:MAG TPA: hypothetical protein VHT70_00845 [Candidatus Saccharimonadales bacterium]|jgi:hypothetical protein|nr:hypothetical protein [Candidatus Saccharimonadales bacterium]